MTMVSWKSTRGAATGSTARALVWMVLLFCTDLLHLTLACLHYAGCCGTWTCQMTRIKFFMESEPGEAITVMPSFHLLFDPSSQLDGFRV